mmetsp:Transcript_7645/g.12840  ORF Transcript_7645/g.12840 Transcript_7645/m.12840 type:complete len:104 (-) Transcript_7645:368-679(-)|eukprot:CAMPEP_0184342434 /NCGR_PEP_ID=MMETSP1089-20130417/11055_1 /TAXON_ID=38269 ORGANISM="Gloeochaete wittrockiana, Strain SAG46.84" /NCGR_SAMPLE_ID=MMETSP1089 /ASSEMBLY_ACC=CAM_ASM_000445 /LENGTH=103 /DNA_ID=CAMNT_0026671309 /DNA_START=911 /DNA_END=1222 /DNA_ORIENTATION=+
MDKLQGPFNTSKPAMPTHPKVTVTRKTGSRSCGVSSCTKAVMTRIAGRREPRVKKSPLRKEAAVKAKTIPTVDPMIAEKILAFLFDVGMSEPSLLRFSGTTLE